MKPITKLYLKTFFWTGIPYGLIMLGIDLAIGNGFILEKLLFMIFFFGGFMSLILVTYNRYRLKKIGVEEISDVNLNVRQNKILKSDLNKSELVEKLKTDPLIRQMQMKEIENGIILKPGMTWKSWGEEIRIIQQSNGESDFEYLISSTPKLKTTLVDYGKNLENVNLIEKIIKIG